MRTLSRVAIVSLFLVALVYAALARGDDCPEQCVRDALSRVPVAKEANTPERDSLLVDFAAAIAGLRKSPRPTRQWAALIVTIGSAETNFSPRIVRNECKPWECDHGRARGAFQNHRLSFLSDLWDESPGNVRAQVEMADRVLRRSLTRCRGIAPYPADVLRAYRGGACVEPLRDEARRVALYWRIVR